MLLDAVAREMQIRGLRAQLVEFDGIATCRG